MEYKVVSITNLNRTPRMDGRYRLRVGRTCTFESGPTVGQCLFLRWKKNADGSDYSGLFRTSRVYRAELLNDGTIVVQTHNSIYTFAPCE